MKKVLIVINTIDAGGAETFVMKVFRVLDKEKFCFDFLINKRDSDFYKEEIENLGGKIVKGYSKSRHPFKCYKKVYQTVREGAYKSVFFIAVHPASFIDLMAAKAAGAEKRIVRSTNSKAGGKMSMILASLCRPLMRRHATVMIAPSREAGQWLFGKKSVINKKVKVVHNGIDTKKYQFEKSIRKCKRKELEVEEECLLIGHIGRFNDQKNHKMLLDIFYELEKRNPSIHLIMIGEGENQREIKEKVRSLGLNDKVSFLGIRKDIPDLLMAMDLFVFPSFYEGMPNVIVEAQATGLKCMVSDSVTREVKITDLVTFFSVQDMPSDIAERILKIKIENENRKQYMPVMKNEGYDIVESTRILETLF